MPKRIGVAALAVLLWLLPAPAVLAAGDPLVYAVQEALTDYGYDAGPPDGLLGPRTRAAIRAFENENALPLTGEMTPGLVGALGLSAYASELGQTAMAGARTLARPAEAGVRILAPPSGAVASGKTPAAQTAAGKAVSADAGYDTESRGGGPARLDLNGFTPEFRVRRDHPLLPSAGGAAAGVAGGGVAGAASARPGGQTANAAGTAAPGDAAPAQLALSPSDRQQTQAAAATGIPPVAERFAPRNWLIRDFPADGSPGGAAFGVFLEEGGKVAGPRFASRLRWRAEGAHITLTYRNAIGQEITRTGMLNGLNRIEGHATGPGGEIWRWQAEAQPL